MKTSHRGRSKKFSSGTKVFDQSQKAYQDAFQKYCLQVLEMIKASEEEQLEEELSFVLSLWCPQLKMKGWALSNKVIY